MPDIKLNFINNSNDKNNSQIVIFQKNVDTSYDELAVAWLVISNCGQGWNHPFTYPMAMQVSATDSWGNFSQQKIAYNGNKFAVIQDKSGDVLQPAGEASSPNEVDVLNGLGMGSVNANIYKDGKLLATKTNIPPGGKAVFQFLPVIWIGAVSQVEQGELINSAVIQDINTQLSLFGIKSADVVMTGGGAGPKSTAFQFNLENIVYA
jgi:hypothetical protein